MDLNAVTNSLEGLRHSARGSANASYTSSSAAAAPATSFQQLLQASSQPSSNTASSSSLEAAGANIQGLMRSESYRSLPLSPLNSSSSPGAGSSSVPAAGDYSSYEDLIAAFGGLSSNPVSAEEWRSYKPKSWSEEGFQRKINETNYLYSLLDENNLPYGLTREEEGIARSTDISSTNFEECEGGILRVDNFSTGDREYHTFIPVMEWEHVTSGGGRDPVLGDIYKKQTPFGFVVRFTRDGSGAPGGYDSDAYDNKVASLLAEG